MNRIKNNRRNFEGIVFDLETQDMKQDDSYPLMSIAVTWDKKQGFRTWRERDVKRLINYISKFPYVVGANLMGFDYRVLENYVPKVRSSLGRKTIDILTHARWGSVIQDIQEALNRLLIEFEGEPESKDEWKTYFDRLRNKIMCYGLTLDEKYRFVPDMKNKSRISREVGISLSNLASSTLQKRKKGKSSSAPELYRSGKHKELISYCKNDVLLTRDIFIYGIRNGYVSSKRIGYILPVWWIELVQYLKSHPIKGKSSTFEADNFAWQISHIKSSILKSEYYHVGSYIRDWKSVVQKIISSYNPKGNYPGVEEKELIQKLFDDGVID